ncbi:hypothetical protein HDV01_006974 [Terramyces sp. JEL0728]|nr:hypothetical protein HDV01_006974 [Terramyces sp. JEL0728]
MPILATKTTTKANPTKPRESAKSAVTRETKSKSTNQKSSLKTKPNNSLANRTQVGKKSPGNPIPGKSNSTAERKKQHTRNQTDSSLYKLQKNAVGDKDLHASNKRTRSKTENSVSSINKRKTPGILPSKQSQEPSTTNTTTKVGTSHNLASKKLPGITTPGTGTQKPATTPGTGTQKTTIVPTANSTKEIKKQQTSSTTAPQSKVSIPTQDLKREKQPSVKVDANISRQKNPSVVPDRNRSKSQTKSTLKSEIVRGSKIPIRRNNKHSLKGTVKKLEKHSLQLTELHKSIKTIDLHEKNLNEETTSSLTENTAKLSKLKTQNHDLHERIAFLESRLLKEEEKLKGIPKLTSIVPTSLEANIHLRYQYHKNLENERKKYAALQLENEGLVLAMKDLALNELKKRKAKDIEVTAQHHNDISYWKTKLKELELDNQQLVDLIAKRETTIEKTAREKEYLHEEMVTMRRLQMHLSNKLDQEFYKENDESVNTTHDAHNRKTSTKIIPHYAGKLVRDSETPLRDGNIEKLSPHFEIGVNESGNKYLGHLKHHYHPIHHQKTANKLEADAVAAEETVSAPEQEKSGHDAGTELPKSPSHANLSKQTERMKESTPESHTESSDKLETPKKSPHPKDSDGAQYMEKGAVPTKGGRTKSETHKYTIGRSSNVENVTNNQHPLPKEPQKENNIAESKETASPSKLETEPETHASNATGKSKAPIVPAPAKEKAGNGKEMEDLKGNSAAHPATKPGKSHLKASSKKPKDDSSVVIAASNTPAESKDNKKGKSIGFKDLPDEPTVTNEPSIPAHKISPKIAEIQKELLSSGDQSTPKDTQALKSESAFARFAKGRSKSSNNAAGVNNDALRSAKIQLEYNAYVDNASKPNI